jgi:hypothetical protein
MNLVYHYVRVLIPGMLGKGGYLVLSLHGLLVHGSLTNTRYTLAHKQEHMELHWSLLQEFTDLE